MNSADGTTTLAWGVLLLALVVAGFAAMLILAFVGPQRRARLAQVFVQCFLVGVVGVAVVGGIKWTRGRPLIFTGAAPSIPRVEPLKPRVSPPVVSSAADSVKSDIELPEWTRQPVRVDGKRKLIAVSSGRFASEEEAELHGFQQAAANAVKAYSSLDPRGIGAVQPQHMDLVKTTAIKQRFLEVTQHDFGKFKAPMHQLWLQVELTPGLGDRLSEPWRQAAVEARLRTLTGWSLWGTAAAALAAFALRLDAAWNGRRRAVVAGTAIALTLGSLAFLA